MESQDNNSGIVYVLSNPAMPGFVKIGRTTREKVDDRMKELNNTSVPMPFECEYACRVEDIKKVELALHIAFSPHRVSAQREFFRMAPEHAIAILKLLEKEDVTPAIVKEIDAETDEETKEVVRKFKISRRPPLNFEVMKIPVGSTLKYTESEETVTVCGPRKIIYKDEEQSLTKVTQSLLELDYAVQPTRYWTFEGKNLQEIYETTHTINDEDE